MASRRLRSPMMMATRSMSSALASSLRSAQRVVFITGAGVSAESGVPTFRGAGGLWRRYEAASLASPSAFAANPGLVWQFYHYRRELVLKTRPNAAHLAIADFENRHKDKNVAVITQNVDELHSLGGSKKVLELHGSLFRTRCTKCGFTENNRVSPITQGLDKALNEEAQYVENEDLPKCSCPKRALLRPDIVWFGENLDAALIREAQMLAEKCDVCIVVGTSAVVYPAAGLAPLAKANGAIVAEFNLELTHGSDQADFHFGGKCGQTLPPILNNLDTNEKT